jgi:hypothetical protein
MTIAHWITLAVIILASAWAGKRGYFGFIGI